MNPRLHLLLWNTWETSCLTRLIRKKGECICKVPDFLLFIKVTHQRFPILSFSDLSLDVNSDVIIVGIKGMEAIYLQEPITIEFEIHEVRTGIIRDMMYNNRGSYILHNPNLSFTIFSTGESFPIWLRFLELLRPVSWKKFLWKILMFLMFSDIIHLNMYNLVYSIIRPRLFDGACFVFQW